MRRRTNTLCQSSDLPKQIDRFKKRQPPRILFAEQVNYSMAINPLEMLQTSSNESSSEISQKSHNSKQNQNHEASLQFVQEEYTNNEIQIKLQQKITQIELKQAPNHQNILKEKARDKEPQPKKEIVIIGQNIIYEEKTKGFRKGTRRRYSHKNSDYMTY